MVPDRAVQISVLRLTEDRRLNTERLRVTLSNPPFYSILVRYTYNHPLTAHYQRRETGSGRTNACAHTLSIKKSPKRAQLDVPSGARAVPVVLPTGVLFGHVI